MAQPIRLKLTPEDLANADRIQDALGCRGISTPISVALELTAMLLEARADSSQIMLRSPDGVLSKIEVTYTREKVHVG